jgi:hypothetical protein
MHYLSIATIARGEALYIEEWVKYHLGIGVDHIYLYDNEYKHVKEFPVRLVHKCLGPQVTLIPFEGETMQTKMTEHALFNFRKATRWLAFTDVDEFFIPYKTDNLKEVLSAYEKYPALGVHWRLFGSSNRKSYSPEPVLERFTRRAAEVDRHIKCITVPTKTYKWVTVHKFTHGRESAVDENYIEIPESESRPELPTADIIGINHYVTKSYEECLERRSRPRADIPAKHNFVEFFPAHDRNDVEDLRALELWNKIK